jgi:hypothetical protein
LFQDFFLYCLVICGPGKHLVRQYSQAILGALRCCRLLWKTTRLANIDNGAEHFSDDSNEETVADFRRSNSEDSKDSGLYKKNERAEGDDKTVADMIPRGIENGEIKLEATLNNCTKVAATSRGCDKRSLPKLHLLCQKFQGIEAVVRWLIL